MVDSIAQLLEELRELSTLLEQTKIPLSAAEHHLNNARFVLRMFPDESARYAIGMISDASETLQSLIYGDVPFAVTAMEELASHAKNG
ncbi:hypothetical protein [Glutamicibacter ardleyensis]|uniref:hypothetical protein n=1 Tax=Glutamicibacter ardleyensis TaxID=225894 RepID=UPI003FD11AF5